MPSNDSHTGDGSGAMFDAIAPRYDLVNRLISLGSDQRWRRRTVDALRLRAGARVLDLATGTGDLALRIARSEPQTTVVGLDPSPGMLAVARRKLTHHRDSNRLEFVLGDAQALPFSDRSFDGITMAFGIRNIPDQPRALAEMARVARPRSRIVILELSDPPPGPIGWLARRHVHVVVPWVGALLSGAREYRYLSRSIAAFPRAEVFAATMRSAGLEVIEVVRLSFGAAHIYVAEAGGAS